ncbi:hypothetical protein G6F68_003111 [Rhizopus microsporus]|nr:hypothetical protein G6F68_003111 [Rhizopus microsporus]
MQTRDIHFKFGKDANLTGATLFIRTPKEAQQKHSALGALSEKSMCPVFTLFTFMEKTEHLRSELPIDHTVFLAYVNNPSKVRSIQPSTVADIVKQAMQEAGIDTQVYGPHSLRSASSTKAVQLGYKIDDVKKHANWSLSADTFERFYFKPSHQERTSQSIMGLIFSSSENSTTSEVETEATKVDLGTTFNRTVAEMETKDVVRPTPWFRRFFKQQK